MKLKSASFDDMDDLAEATVTMTAKEMALVYGFLGFIAPRTVTQASALEWGNLFSDLADEWGSIGNRFYVDGWPAPKIGRSLAAVSQEGTPR